MIRSILTLIMVMGVMALSAGQAPEDFLRLVNQEKQEFSASSNAAVYPPGLLKQVQTLMEQAEKTGDVKKRQLLLAQARWLIPDPQETLPPHVSRVLGTLKFKHDFLAFSAVYAPDGKTLITCSQDGTVRHWELASGRMKSIWTIGKPLSALALSPDGKWLAVAEGFRFSPNVELGAFATLDQHAIHVYELATGQKKWELPGHGKNAVLSLAFSPDGKWLASGSQIGLGSNQGIKIWDLATGKEDRPVNTVNPVTVMVWSKDSSRLYIAFSNTNKFDIINMKTGITEKSSREPGKVHCMALSPDGSTLAIAGELSEADRGTSSIRLYSTADWKLTGTLLGHSSPVLALVYSQDGKKLISSSAKPEATVKVWELARKAMAAQYQGHANDVLGLALRPDGAQIASVSLDHTIRLWQAVETKGSKIIARHEGPVWTLALGNKDNELLTVSADQSAVLWDLTAVKAQQKYAEHKAPVTVGVVRPDFGEIATGGGDHIIRLWNPKTGQTNQTLTGHSEVITTLAYSPDGKRLYSGSADRTVKAWDLAEKKTLYTLSSHRSVVMAVSVNLDGTLLATGGADNIIRIHQAQDGKEVRALSGHSGAITALAFSPGGQLLASVGADGKIHLWDTSTGTSLRSLSGHVGQLMAVAFSPNLKYLATAGADEVIRIWSLSSGQELRVLQGHTDWVTSLVFLSDGETLLSGSVDGTVRLWEDSKAVELPTYGHRQPIKYQAISPKGDRLATGSDDGQIILWDTQTGNEVATLHGHLSGVLSLAFSSDAKLLLSADREMTLKLWDIEKAKELQNIPTRSNTVVMIGFVANNRGIVASVGNSEVMLWSLTGANPPQVNLNSVQKFTGTDQQVSALSMTQERILCGSMDGTAKFWQIQDPIKAVPGQTLQCYQQAIHDLALTPSGKHLLTVNGDSLFKWWEVGQKKEQKSWKGRPVKTTGLAIHPSGSRALASFENYEIVLWDTAKGEELRSWKFRGPITYLLFSPESKHAFATASNGVVYRLDLP